MTPREPPARDATPVARSTQSAAQIPGATARAWERTSLFGSILACTGFAGLAALATFVGAWSEHLGAFLILHAVSWTGMLLVSRGRASWVVVLSGAVLFRVAILLLTPSLSDDIYRYVWEGRVQIAGFDPYVLPPVAPQLESLRDALWQQVNHPQYAAIYPPVAQLAFRALAHWGGVLVFKSVLCLLDLVTCGVLAMALHRRGLSPSRLVLYAWNPLVVVEIAGSGHLEPLGVLPLVAAVVLVGRRRALGWTLLAASTAAKYAAGITIPAFLAVAPPRKRGIAAAVLFLLAVFAPYAGAGMHLFDSLRVYAEHWRYNDLLFALVQRFSADPHHARMVALGLTGAGGLAVAVWRRPLEQRALAALTLTLLLSPTIHPWYLIWPLALVPLAPNTAILAWSATLPIAYLHLFPAFGWGPYATPSGVPQLLEVAPVAVFLLGIRLRRSRTPKPASVRTTAATT
jgi:hypothetical protein